MSIGRKAWTIVLVLGSSACLPNKDASQERRAESSERAARGTLAGASGSTGNVTSLEIKSSQAAIREVSAFSLDDLKFTVLGIAVGLQDFMNAKAPLLSLQIPRDADFVEVLRCKSDVTINTGSESISIVNLAISSLSDEEKAAYYRRNDFFRGASENPNCELVSDALVDSTLVDSLAPSGSYRYLLRACVNPERLIDKDKLTSRNCSRRVAVSPLLESYVNTRREEELNNLRQAQVHAGKLDQLNLRLRFLADSANAALDQCEKTGHKRKVDKIIRDSWVTVGAAVIDTAVEIKTLQLDPGSSGVKGILNHYKKVISLKSSLSERGDALRDVLQLIGSTEGYLLANVMKTLASSSEDFERSCAQYKRLFDESQIAVADFATAGLSYQYFKILALQAAGKAEAGETK